MALASILLGWFVAGRALRPLRTITTTTREISAHNLHRRLALGGPDDELKDLGDTIDALLARLEDSFQAQRAFVANASHELRTPLALTRAMLQFALADPKLTFDALKGTCADVLDAGAEQEQLIEALLTLARSQQDIEHRENFDLAALVEETIQTHRQQAAEHELTIDATLRPASASGDPRLLRRLVGNLLENALRYNVPHGHIRVRLESSPGHATLTVANTGPQIPMDQIRRLTQPFQRLLPERTSDTDGHGLGLSIVAAITAAHDAKLDIQPNPEGGLLVAVTFRSPSPSNQARPPSVTPAAPAAPTALS
jgi:signal transduction histidine kinase